MLSVNIIPIYHDNYAYVIQSGNAVGLVDVGDSDPVTNFLEDHDLKPTVLFTTHHHWDHINGVVDIKKKYRLHHVAPEKDVSRIPLVEHAVRDGDTLTFGDETIEVIETPGHTLNHICYYFKESGILFTGDTLFPMGCGRLFEGTSEQMFDSFQKIKALPDDTQIYCGHEYSQSNGEFALTIEPKNEALLQHMEEVNELRNLKKPTIPTTLDLEKQTNIFMRAKDTYEFKEFRELKDKF